MIRLVGAVLIEMHGDRIVGDRRYSSEGHMAKRYETSDHDPVAAIESGDTWAPRITSKPTIFTGHCRVPEFMAVSVQLAMAARTLTYTHNLLP